MSLETLRQMRRAGKKPTATVKLVAGPVPDWLAKWPDVIAVTEAPERMDWRAVIGLPLAVFVADGYLDVGERAYRAAAAAGCVSVGVAFSDGAHSADEAANGPLWAMWEVLCR